MRMNSRDRNKKFSLEFIERLEKLLSTREEIIKVQTYGRKKEAYFVLNSNLKKLVEYYKYKIINDNVKPYSALRFVSCVIYFAGFIRDKSFESAVREDIEAYLNYRKDVRKNSDMYLFMLKSSLRDFFRWFYKCEDGYPDVVKWMKVKLPKNNQLPDLITLDEIQQMLNVCDNSRDKALVSVLYESGGRISEILNLRICDAKIDEYGCILYCSDGKTGGRPIRVCQSTNDIKHWLNVHPFRNDENSPLFPSLSNKNYGGFINTTSGNSIIKKLSKRADIERNIHPHMFRKRRATDLSKVLSDREMRIFFGWGQNSTMPSYYSHLNAKDVDDKILLINDKIPKNELKPSNIPTFTCYRCSEVNNISNKFCQKCEAPLEQKTIEKIEDVKKIVSEVTMYVFEKMKSSKIGEDDLEELVKTWYKNTK